VILFLETLKLTGIKSEVLAYTTRGAFRKSTGDTLYTYSRREKLYTGIFKSHDEVYGSKVKARIANFGNVARKENCDPCSVRVAHDRLVNRREKRKISAWDSFIQITTSAYTRQPGCHLTRCWPRRSGFPISA
jgi:cobalamin biosynthesis protein CobT